MTRKEYTGVRDLSFSGWIRENLPDSYSGFRVSDLDFILANVQTKRFMCLEVKTRGADVKKWQRELFQLLHTCISAGVKCAKPEWEYLGMHLVTFTNTLFADGDVFLDKKLITETDLKSFLSMENA